jgi:hypothetical protein
MGTEVVHLRIPDKAYQKLARIAAAEKRPLANLLRYIVIRFIEQREKSK